MRYLPISSFLSFVLSTPVWAAPLDPNCAEASAQVLFDNALCVCGDYRGAADLTVTGSVGINGSLQSNAAVRASQTLAVQGMTQSSGDLAVGALQAQGPVFSNGSIDVANDAVFGGNVSANIVRVGGITTLDPGAALYGNTVPAEVTRTPVSLTPPCDCDSDALGLDALFDDAAAHNDNDAAELRANALNGFNQTQQLRLKTGRYYLDSINGNAPLEIETDGRVALFIGGNISVNQAVSITALPGASLDVYVRGNLLLSGRLGFGSDTPAAARLWVLGILGLRDGIDLHGLLYAPHSQFNLADTASLQGAAILGQLNHNQSFTMGYDPGIATVGQTCASPTTPPDAPPTSPTTPPTSPTTPPDAPPTSPTTPPDAPPTSPTTPPDAPPTSPTTPPDVPPVTDPQSCSACGDCQNGGTCLDGLCTPCSDSAPCCEGLTCRPDGTCGPDNA